MALKRKWEEVEPTTSGHHPLHESIFEFMSRLSFQQKLQTLLSLDCDVNDTGFDVRPNLSPNSDHFRSLPDPFPGMSALHLAVILHEERAFGALIDFPGIDLNIKSGEPYKLTDLALILGKRFHMSLKLVKRGVNLPKACLNPKYQGEFSSRGSAHGFALFLTSGKK
jgi:hypothetical protein